MRPSNAPPPLATMHTATWRTPSAVYLGMLAMALAAGMPGWSAAMAQPAVSDPHRGHPKEQQQLQLDHGQPWRTDASLREGMERIRAFAGKDASRFRGYDQQVHEAAQWLAQAAQRQDGAAIITAFANVQTACLGCHQQFRKPFQEHFHAQP